MVKLGASYIYTTGCKNLPKNSHFWLIFLNAFFKIHIFIINNYFQRQLVLLLVINLLNKSNNMQKVYQTRHCKNG